MAAMQNISPSLYEAAEIDGASGFVKFTRITFPLISPTTFYLVIVRLIATFKIVYGCQYHDLWDAGQGKYYDCDTSLRRSV